MSAIQNKQLFLSRIPTNGFQESLSKMTKGDLKIIHIFLHLLLQALNLLNLQLITPPPLLWPVHLYDVQLSGRFQPSLEVPTAGQ